MISGLVSLRDWRSQSPNCASTRPLAPLIGRSGDVVAVVALLRGGESRLLTLTGPAASARRDQPLQRRAERASDFVDGIVFVDLAPLRHPDIVLCAVARRLGMNLLMPTIATDFLADLVARFPSPVRAIRGDWGSEERAEFEAMCHNSP